MEQQVQPIDVTEQQPVALQEQGVMDLTALRRQDKIIKEIINSDLFVEGIHYGHIPGTPEDQKSLYKDGAELIGRALGIHKSSVDWKDLSTEGEARYSFDVTVSHMGHVVGIGTGECSSLEEKFGWREAVCDEEFEETPQEQRRIKYKKKPDGTETIQQIATTPADQRHNVRSRAEKRAYVMAIKAATGIGGYFKGEMEEGERGAGPDEKPKRQKSQASKTGTATGVLVAVNFTADEKKPNKVTVKNASGANVDLTFFDNNTPAVLKDVDDFSGWYGSTVEVAYKENKKGTNTYYNLTDLTLLDGGEEGNF